MYVCVYCTADCTVRKRLFADSSFSIQIATDSSQRGKENIHIVRSSWYDQDTGRVHNWIINVAFSVQDASKAADNAEEVRLTLEDLEVMGHRVKSYISDNAPGALLEGELLRKLLKLPVLWIITCGTNHETVTFSVRKTNSLSILRSDPIRRTGCESNFFSSSFKYHHLTFYSNLSPIYNPVYRQFIIVYSYIPVCPPPHRSARPVVADQLPSSACLWRTRRHHQDPPLDDPPAPSPPPIRPPEAR
jgi:hypothetical protein